MNISARLVIEHRPAEKESKPLDLAAFIPAIVAGFIVIAGWIVVEKFARRRERRTDLRGAVSDFAKAVDEVVAASTTFYQLAGNDPQAQSLAATIRIKVGSLSSHLILLRESGLNLETDELLKRFRQSVTGGAFDEVSRQPLAKDSPTFARLAADGQSLSREVQQAMLAYLLGSKDKKPNA